MGDPTDSVLILEFARSHAPQDPHAFRFEPQTYTLRTERGGRALFEVDWSAALLADIEALRQPDRDPEVVQRLGETMARFLERASWATRAQAIAEAHDAGQRVVITIRSSAAELHALPWELVTLPGRGQHLGSLPRVLLRYERPETVTATESPSPRPEGGRVLLAWSAAAGAVPAAAHESALRKACEEGHLDGADAVEVLSHASVRSIADALTRAERNDRPIAVLHLLCHGGKAGQSAGLVLDGKSRPVVVAADTWRTMLAPHAASLRLVVLAACDGGNMGEPGSHLGSVAQALHAAGIQSVVASRYSLSASGSTTLTESLYEALLVRRESLQDALLDARAQLALDPVHLDWPAVQYSARAEDGDDTRPFVVRPYRGLLAFETRQAEFFHGRADERQAVTSCLKGLVDGGKPRLVVVAGASGTGKSSLVRAGAVPDIVAGRGGPWEHAIIRPGSDPVGALEGALADRNDESHSLLLVIDQFEEIFTHTRDPELRQRFARSLWALANGDTKVCCILSLRVDFLGRCGELRLDERGTRLDQVAYDDAHRVFVAQMSPPQLREAIVRPAEAVGIVLAEGLAERIVTEVASEPGALPLMQYTLDQLWQIRNGQTLTQEAYDDLGGVVGAIERRADALLDEFTEQELHWARQMLTQLVGLGDDDTGDTRRRVPVEQLWAGIDGERRGIEAVLHRFVDERLVVRDDRSAGGATVEIAHEALVRRWERLRDWLGDERERRIGRYIVLEATYERGREQHFTAYDPTLDRRVKLRQLRVGRRGTEERRRIQEQARALARLSHPHAEAIYDVGVSKGHVYLATELVEGRPLGAWLEQDEPSQAEIVERFIEAGRALAAAHEIGVIHRGFNPDSIRIEDGGGAKVVGFALDRRVEVRDTGRSEDTMLARVRARGSGPSPAARSISPSVATVEPSLGSVSKSSVLNDGVYLPPEQLRGLPLVPASDQFAFCLSLYEAIHGERPFSGPSLVFNKLDSTTSRAVTSSGSTIAPLLRKVLSRGLAGDPKQRWPSMDALCEELVSSQAQPSAGAVARSFVLPVALGVLALVGGLTWWGLSGDEPPSSTCSDADVSLEEVWDITRRGDTRAALLSVGRASAISAWKRAEPRLEGYASVWIERRSAACESTEEHASLVAACLDERRMDLREAVNVLLRADAQTIDHVDALVQGLPRLERCDDLEIVQAEALPTDPEAKAEVLELRERLAVVRAKFLGGDETQAEALASEVVEQAGDSSREYGEGLRLRGQVRAQAGKIEAALGDLEAAVGQALAGGHTAVAARAAIALARVIGRDDARVEAAQVWATLAISLAEPATVDAEVRTEALAAMGWVQQRRGDAADAKQWYERALTAQVELRGPEHRSVVLLHEALAEVALSQGKTAEARENAEQAVKLAEQGSAGELGLAAARFLLARSLPEVSATRARELAEEALDFYSAHGGHEARVKAIEQWLQSRS